VFTARYALSLHIRQTTVTNYAVACPQVPEWQQAAVGPAVRTAANTARTVSDPKRDICDRTQSLLTTPGAPELVSTPEPLL
jgi:hypothetical protein